MLCDDADVWDGGVGGLREGIYMTDSPHCTAQTKTTVKQLYSNLKNGRKEREMRRGRLTNSFEGADCNEEERNEALGGGIIRGPLQCLVPLRNV